VSHLEFHVFFILLAFLEEGFKEDFQQQTRLKLGEENRIEVGAIKYQVLGSKSSRNIQI
jgi:hypothetical protein